MRYNLELVPGAAAPLACSDSNRMFMGIRASFRFDRGGGRLWRRDWRAWADPEDPDAYPEPVVNVTPLT
jgi:hypothetical protein